MSHRDFYGRDAAPPRKRVVIVEGEVIGSSSSGFGAFSAMPDAQRVYLQGKMEATVAAIRTAFSVAQARVAVTPNAIVGTLLSVLTLGLSQLGIKASTTETKQNVSNALTALKGSFEQVVVGAMPRVYAGELDPARWFNMTNGYVETIGSMLDELGESGMAASLSASFAGFSKDIADFLLRFKAGVEKTFDFMPLIIGGAALLGTYLVVTRLLPQRRLSGYTRRHRKLRLTP